MGLSKCYFYEHRNIQTNAAKFEIEKNKTKIIMQKNLPGKDL